MGVPVAVVAVALLMGVFHATRKMTKPATEQLSDGEAWCRAHLNARGERYAVETMGRAVEQLSTKADGRTV